MMTRGIHAVLVPQRSRDEAGATNGHLVRVGLAHDLAIVLGLKERGAVDVPGRGLRCQVQAVLTEGQVS